MLVWLSVLVLDVLARVGQFTTDGGLLATTNRSCFVLIALVVRELLAG